MVIERGARYTGTLPSNLAGAQKLCGVGCTLLIKHAEQHSQELASIAATFAETFRAPVDVHLYATPAGTFGFSWHYDAEDVFILQTSGEKKYLLRKNTVNPWPLEETIPTDMQYEREIMPLMRVVLQAGDLLYIPCGYWHRGYTLDNSETAFSIAVGVMSHSAMDVYDLLRNELLDSLVWRQRLPMGPVVVTGDEGSQPELSVAYEHLLAQLASDLSRTLGGPSFRAKVIERFADASRSTDVGPAK